MNPIFGALTLCLLMLTASMATVSARPRPDNHLFIAQASPPVEGAPAIVIERISAADTARAHVVQHVVINTDRARQSAEHEAESAETYMPTRAEMPRAERAGSRAAPGPPETERAAFNPMIPKLKVDDVRFGEEIIHLTALRE